MEATTTEVSPSKLQRKVYHSAIEKFQKSNKLKKEFIQYVEQNNLGLLRDSNKKQRIKECCNEVSFGRHLQTGDVQLISANFCKYDKICIACATKRAMRMIKKFSQWIQKHNLYDKKRYSIVLTIRHNKNDTLQESMQRLMLYKSRLARAYRNSKRPIQVSKSFFSQFDGMAMSIEITHTRVGWWHPHINILACSDTEIGIDTDRYDRNQNKRDKQGRPISTLTNEVLKAERKSHTSGTSYIHNIRKIVVDRNQFSRSGIWEVFKYAIKFSDLSVEQLAQVMTVQANNQYRFFATYWIFRGRKIECTDRVKDDWSQATFLYDEDAQLFEKQK